ncbi:hypothetical protein ACFWDI_05730 [Streptomyces sp. NPDC060064]|uniref:hypothetical protein n=1 Tax=Streptomyces sp. NPDC060064 TaxID=3347049 RepID=UPI0036A85651
MSAGDTYKNGKWVWHQTSKKDQESQRRYRAYRASPSHYLIDDAEAKQRAQQVAVARAQAIARAKAEAEAERRKRDGIWGSIKKGNFSAAWDNTVDEVWDERLGNSDWRNHKGVDIAIGAVAAIGSASRRHTISVQDSQGGGQGDRGWGFVGTRARRRPHQGSKW